MESEKKVNVEPKYKIGDEFSCCITLCEVNTISGEVKYVLNNNTDSPVTSEELDNYYDKIVKTDISKDRFYEGVEFAQNVYKQLENLSAFELKEIFGSAVLGGSLWAIIRKYDIYEIDSMINQFRIEFEIGDEFIITKEGRELAVIITNIDDDSEVICFMTKYGTTGYFPNKRAFLKAIKKRTGDRYDITISLREDK